MDIAKLETFVAIVDAGSINAAAAKLNRVQSSLSIRIKKLEEGLGTELFLRKNNGIELTQAGKIYYEYAVKIIALNKEARRAIQQFSESSAIKIGVINVLEKKIIDNIIEFCDLNNVTISIITGYSEELAKLLLKGDIDFAIFCNQKNEDEFITVPLYIETMILTSSTLTASVSTLEDFKKINPLRFLIHSRLSASMNNITMLCRSIGDSIKIKTIECGSHDILISTLLKGGGFALIPKTVVQEHESQGKPLKTHSLQGKFSKLPIMLSYKRDMKNSAAKSIIKNIFQMLSSTEIP
ncbi:LysR family transcriptional regulator [Pluralibacter gergoviae]